jgi:hypothetical protein
LSRFRVGTGVKGPERFRVGTDLERPEPVPCSRHGYDTVTTRVFEPRERSLQKIVGFFMNFRRGSGGSHGGRDFFLCRVLGPLLWGFMVLVSIWISSSVHTIPHTITLVIILLYETSSSLERFIVIAAPITAAADAAAVINTPPTSRHYHCTNTII